MSESVFAAATFNVHGFRGLDRRCDPERTLACIEALNADVIGSQEVIETEYSSLVASLENSGFYSLTVPREQSTAVLLATLS